MRGPSARPESGQASSYKPKAKSSRAQRESEGIVVPDGGVQTSSAKAVRHNAAGGKGPCGGHAAGAGKREGMAGQTGPNDPGGDESRDKVRQLQRQLWAAAKRAPGRRFHALYDQMCRDDILHEAWRRVRRNHGAAGVDRVSIGEVEQYGVQRFLQELGEVLRAGEYGAQVVRRVYIPKADGGQATPGHPDGARPGGADGGQAGAGADLRGGLRAVLVRVPAAAQCARWRWSGSGNWAIKARITCWMPTSRTTSAASSTTSCSLWWDSGSADRRVLKLVRQWLQPGVMEDGVVRHPVAGTPQGGVISPLLSNIYLHVLDRVWAKHGAHLGELVRYADDFVVMCRTRRHCEEAQGRIEHVLGRLGLKLHPQKTRRVVLTRGQEGFDFLGCHLHKRMSGRLWEQKRPATVLPAPLAEPRAMKRVRQRVRELTPTRTLPPGCAKRHSRAEPGAARLGAVLPQRQRGRSVHRCGRLRRSAATEPAHQTCRSPPEAGQAQCWDRAYYEHLGLHRLRGTIRYLGQPPGNRRAA